MHHLYLHIPFCRRRCSYCDFHFSTNRSKQSAMVEAIAAELEMRKGFGGGNGELRTLYFGGGTPSLLDEKELVFLFEKIRGAFRLEPGAEVTLEANPEDLTPEKLSLLAELGVNRLSIGLQSFDAKDLDWMNRAHSPEQAAACVPAARKAGIHNITVDLIFGLPGMSMESWEANLEKALALSLTIFPFMHYPSRKKRRSGIGFMKAKWTCRKMKRWKRSTCSPTICSGSMVIHIMN
ncbi:MAG: coproporphyrinogen-III oxidase family protein [Bacteroidia bacterium]